MNERLVGTSTVTRKSNGAGALGIPTDVDELLGEPSGIVWFVDEDTGLLYAVPESEVTIR